MTWYPGHRAYMVRDRPPAATVAGDIPHCNLLGRAGARHRPVRRLLGVRGAVPSSLVTLGRGCCGPQLLSKSAIQSRGQAQTVQAGLHAEKSLDLDLRNLAQPARLREGRNALGLDRTERR